VVIASNQSAIPVSGTFWQATQPVSGTFWQATQPVSIASSVAVTGPLTDTQLRASAVHVSLTSLPSLAAGSNAIGSITNTSFASTQSGNWSTRIQDGSGNAITSTSNALDVNIKNSSIAVTGTFYQAIQPVSGTVTANISGSISNTTFASTQSGTWNVGLNAGTNAIGSITNTAFGISGTLPAFASIPTFTIDQTTPGTTNKVDIGSNGTVAITGSVGVTGPLTDTQLRASAVSITGSISNTSFGVTQATASNLNATVVGTGTFAVQAAQSGTWNVGTVSTITNPVTVSQSTATSLRTAAEAYQSGSPVGVSNPLYVTVAASVTGGDSVYHLVSAASPNPVNIKASAGIVTGWYIYNSNASPRKVAFHNTAITPTAGSNVYYSLVIPGSSGANVSFPSGLNFSTGIAITTVTGLTDSDATAVGASDLIINIFYK
jgi:hypothetical protein